MKKIKIVNNYGVYKIMRGANKNIIDLEYVKDIEKRKMSKNQIVNINVKLTNWDYLKSYNFNGIEYCIINDYEVIKL